MAKSIMKHSNKRGSKKQGHTILTPREVEILSMVAIGLSNQQVSDKFCISHHTVKRHLYNIFRKINVPNRLQAALWSARNL
jgi:DNA-binding CsgD family transcriptional regulator